MRSCVVDQSVAASAGNRGLSECQVEKYVGDIMAYTNRAVDCEAGLGMRIPVTALSRKKARNYMVWVTTEDCQELYDEYLNSHVAQSAPPRAATPEPFWTATLPVATAWAVDRGSPRTQRAIVELRAIPMRRRHHPAEPWKLVVSPSGWPVFCAYAVAADGVLREHQLFELAMKPASREGQFIPLTSIGAHCPVGSFTIATRTQRIAGSLDHLPSRFVLTDLHSEGRGSNYSDKEWSDSSADSGESSEKDNDDDDDDDGMNVAGRSKRSRRQHRQPPRRAFVEADHGYSGGREPQEYTPRAGRRASPRAGTQVRAVGGLDKGKGIGAALPGGVRKLPELDRARAATVAIEAQEVGAAADNAPSLEMPSRCHPCHLCVPCERFWGSSLPEVAALVDDPSQSFIQTFLTPEEDVPPPLPDVGDAEFQETQLRLRAKRYGRQKTGLKYYGTGPLSRTAPGLWVSRKSVGGILYYLGSFVSEELAARAHDKAKLVFTSCERLNFNPREYKEEYPFIFRLSMAQLQIYLRPGANGRVDEVEYPGVTVVTNSAGEQCFLASHNRNRNSQANEHLKQYETEDEAMRAVMEAALLRSDYALAGKIMNTRHVRTVIRARSNHATRSSRAQLQGGAPAAHPATAPLPEQETTLPVRISEIRRSEATASTAVAGSRGYEVELGRQVHVSVSSPTPSVSSRLPVAADNAAPATPRPAPRCKRARIPNEPDATPPSERVATASTSVKRMRGGPVLLSTATGAAGAAQPAGPQVTRRSDVVPAAGGACGDGGDEGPLPEEVASSSRAPAPPARASEERVAAADSRPLPETPAPAHPIRGPALAAPSTVSVGELATRFQELCHRQWRAHRDLCQRQQQEWTQALQAGEVEAQATQRPPAEVQRQWELWQQGYRRWFQQYCEWQVLLQNLQRRSFVDSVSPFPVGDLPGPSLVLGTSLSQSQVPGPSPTPGSTRPGSRFQVSSPMPGPSQMPEMTPPSQLRPPGFTPRAPGLSPSRRQHYDRRGRKSGTPTRFTQPQFPPQNSNSRGKGQLPPPPPPPPPPQ